SLRPVMSISTTRLRGCLRRGAGAFTASSCRMRFCARFITTTLRGCWGSQHSRIATLGAVSRPSTRVEACQRATRVITSDSNQNSLKARARRMNRNTVSSCLVVLALAGFCGCGSKPASEDSKKAAYTPDKIQGKALVLEDAEAIEAALNGGGSSVYLVDG